MTEREVTGVTIDVRGRVGGRERAHKQKVRPGAATAGGEVGHIGGIGVL